MHEASLTIIKMRKIPYGIKKYLLRVHFSVLNFTESIKSFTTSFIHIYNLELVKNAYYIKRMSMNGARKSINLTF